MSILLTATMLNFSATAAFTSPGSDSELQTGIATIGGVVTIDGSPAISRQTIFSGSSIVTAERSMSTLDLTNRIRLQLNSESTLTLDFSSTSLDATLANGSMRSFVPRGVRAGIATPGASIATDPAQPAAFSIQVESGITTVTVEAGRVHVRNGNNLNLIAARETFSTGNRVARSPEPQHNLSGRRKAFLLLGIGGAVAAILIAVTGDDDDDVFEDGCVTILSPTNDPGCR